jgi:D-alanine-D-alanine ligase
VPSSLAFNKEQAKKAAKSIGLKTPAFIVVDSEEVGGVENAAHQVFSALSPSWVVKPIASGSSVGVTIAKDFHELERALEKAFSISQKAIVEEYIKGKEATCGVIDSFRGQDVYALMPIEIHTPTSNEFYDYNAKYVSEETAFSLPGNFTRAEKEALEKYSKDIHKHLNLSHYSRSDFIVTPRGIYFLEVNTLPGITDHSLIPKALSAAGSTLSEFFTHIIELARQKK